MNRFWWIDPSKLLIFLILPLFVLSALFGAYMMPEFGSTNFLTGPLIALGALCIAVMALGAKIGAVVTNGVDVSRYEFDQRHFDLFFIASILLTLVSHVIFMFPVISDPALVKGVLLGEKGANFTARDALLVITGLTSFTNIAPLVFCMSSLRFLFWGKFAPNFVVLALLWIVAFLAAAHAILGSERIVLLECSLAFALPLFSFWWRLRTIGRIAPILGAMLLIALFAYGEYVRSWAFNLHKFDSFTEFVATRLLAYMAVASNTGAGMLTTMPTVGYPLITSRWFSELPVLGIPSQYIQTYFRNWGNIEFNNPSGVFAAIVDFDIAVGLAYLFVFGALLGLIYGFYRLRHPLAMLAYPLFFTGLVDLTQIWYWGEPRFLPQLIFLALAALFIIRRQRQSYRFA